MTTRRGKMQHRNVGRRMRLETSVTMDRTIARVYDAPGWPVLAVDGVINVSSVFTVHFEAIDPARTML